MADSWLLGGVRGGSPASSAAGVASDAPCARFSLLDLDPGEIYFQDFSVTLSRKETGRTAAAGNNKKASLPVLHRGSLSRVKGRLKICSKSFLFDPADVARPMIKFPLRHVVGVEEFLVAAPSSDAAAPSVSPFSTDAKAGASILLRAKTTVEIKENNVIGPFVFRKHEDDGGGGGGSGGGESFLLTFHYVNVDAALPLMSALLSASRASFGEQSEIVESIQARQAKVKFNRNWLDDAFGSILLEMKAERISPLIVNPGRVVLTAGELYFQPFNNVEPFPCLRLNLPDVSQIFKRRYLLRHVGLEISCRPPAAGRGVTNFNIGGTGGGAGLPSSLSSSSSSAPGGGVGGAFASATLTHVYLVCEDRDARDRLYDAIVARECVAPETDAQHAVTLKWQNGVLSNFDYLMELNNLANRSMCDLTQYPVFPWVLRDYTSPALDLNDPGVFRDLTKPIGALHPERLDYLKRRFQDMPEPRFLYGSHYSTPGFVLFYLVRAAPELMLCLQNGRFDLPDRMFNGIAEAWNNVLTNNSDFKELVPEFYMTSIGDDGKDESGRAPSLITHFGGLGGKFLANYRGIDFGLRQATGKRVQEVELPPWARTPADFVARMREALESDHVSKNLHHWIDLVFGYKQRGHEAIEANNLFHYLTYEGSVDVEAEMDPGQRAAFEAQILEFGQTPTQLFTSPHPQRVAPHRASVASAFPTAAAAAAENDVKNLPRGFAGFKNGREELGRAGAEIPLKNLLAAPKIFKKVHRDEITGIALSRDGKRVITISKDGFLKVNCLEKDKQLVSYYISGMPLTCMQLLSDGDTALVGSSDNHVYLFNLVQCIATKPMDYAHDDSITDVSWTDDVLLTCSNDCSAKLWSLPCNESYGNHPDVVLLAILDHDHPVHAGTLGGGDADVVATGTDAGHIYIWNVGDPSSPLFVLDEFHQSPITRLCFDPHSSSLGAIKLASASPDGVISVIDVSTGTQIFVAREMAKGQPDPLTHISWLSARDDDDDDDDETAGSGARPISRDNNNAAPALSSSSLSASSSGRVRSLLSGLYSGKGSGELDIWDMMEGRRRERLMNEASPVSCVDVAGNVGIAVGYGNGTLVLWLLERKEGMAEAEAAGET